MRERRMSKESANCINKCHQEKRKKIQTIDVEISVHGFLYSMEFLNEEDRGMEW